MRPVRRRRPRPRYPSAEILRELESLDRWMLVTVIAGSVVVVLKLAVLGHKLGWW